MCKKRTIALVFAIGMMLYSFLHICSFLISFYQDIEPDWVMLFKLMCDFILLPSSLLLIIAIYKDNLTIILVSEVCFMATSFGFIVYTAIFLILFTKHREFGIPFFSFIIQRTLFFGWVMLGAIFAEAYRRKRRLYLEDEMWVDLSSSDSEPKSKPATKEFGIKVKLKKAPTVRVHELRPIHYRYSYTTGPPRLIDSKCERVPVRSSYKPALDSGCDPIEYSPYLKREYIEHLGPPQEWQTQRPAYGNRYISPSCSPDVCRPSRRTDIR